VSEDSSTFAAQAFNSTLGVEGLEGRIGFDRLHLQFFSPRANLELPLVRLQIERDESLAGRLCFSSSDRPDWVICTSDGRILQHHALRQQPNTRNQIRDLEAPAEWKRRLTITLALLAGFGVLALLAAVLSGIMVRALVAKIPAEFERQVGDDLIAELRQQMVFIQDPKLMAKLDSAVAPLLNALHQTTITNTFYLIAEPMPNALALPGGHVLVTTRLLELAERPEEIAGVVAHEQAHVSQKHGFRKIISSLGPYLIFRVFLGNSAGVLGVVGESSELLVNQSFSQEYELEADDVGWQSLVAAHIDPRGLADMLRKLQAEHQKLRADLPQFHAFSSHPATQKRIQRLEAKWKKLKDKSGFAPIVTGPDSGW